MGRPLNKKLFGNRNIGTNGSSDNNIGGEGVATVTITTEGTYTSALPTATFSTPDIPGGVRATGVVHGHALTAVATAAGTGYNLGDVLTPTGSGTGTASTFAVDALTVVGITLKNGGTANDVGDIFAFNHPNFEVAMQVRVTAATAGVATAVQIVDGGKFVTGTLPGATDAGGFTRVQTFGTTDMNGQGLQVNFTAWGVSTVQVANQGNYTAISGGAKATTSGNGTGATLTITYGVSGLEVTQKGSGYTTPADAAVTFSAGAAAGTSVLTTDGGATNNNDNAGTNQENAIVAKAQLAGGADAIVDIISQKGAKRFKVTDGTRTGVCNLTAAANLTDGQMSIIATDANGNTYYVTKLTAHKATLTRAVDDGADNDWLYEDESVAPWRFAAAQGSYVQIANA